MMGKTQKGPSSQHDPEYIRLRERLKGYRLDADLTQVQLVKAFKKKHHTFVHKIESGDRRIDPVEFVRWCRACGVDPGEAILQIK